MSIVNYLYNINCQLFVNYCQKYQLLIFFSEEPFYGNYSSLDSHTNAVISHNFVCLLFKMASKTVTRSTVEKAIFLWVFTIILYIDLLFHGHFLNFMLRCLMLFYLPYITVSRLCHLSKPRKWVLWISRDGDNQRIFRVLKF